MIVQLGHRADGGTRGAYRAGSDRWRWSAECPRCFPRRACPCGREIGAHMRKNFRRSGAALRRRGCRSQRRFSRAADAGDHGERVQRNIKIEIFEIVLLGAADVNEFAVHGSVVTRSYDPSSLEAAQFNLVQPILFAQNAAKTRTIDQIEGFLFIGKKLQRRMFGVATTSCASSSVRSIRQRRAAAMSIARRSRRTCALPRPRLHYRRSSESPCSCALRAEVSSSVPTFNLYHTGLSLQVYG